MLKDLKDIFEKRTGLKLKDLPQKLNKFGGYKKGKIYFDGYEQQTYEVLDIKLSDVGGWVVVCKWQDGKVNSHSTALTPGMDFEVAQKSLMSR